MKHTGPIGFALAIAAAVVPTWASAKTTLFERTDPLRDDHGPGSYLYPIDQQQYPSGIFDLRGIEIWQDGDDVVFEVTMRLPVRPPRNIPRRSNALVLPLENNIYLQNIDIYIDTGPDDPKLSSREAIPGRNVILEQGWERAVALVPLPNESRSLLRDWEPVKRVFFAQRIVNRGTKLRTRVPVSFFPHPPSKRWGYSVMVSGAVWENSFNLVDRFARDLPINAFTMPVVTVPERLALGGGDLSYFNPHIVDVLVPAGATQEQVLAIPKPSERRYASIPMVYDAPQHKPGSLARTPATTLPAPAPPEPAPPEEPTTGVRVRVVDIQDDRVVLERTSQEVVLLSHQLGAVLDANEQVIGRVVVVGEFPSFFLARAVEGSSKIQVGATVRFDADKER